jgi:HK97 gp10 family phage protein
MADVFEVKVDGLKELEEELLSLSGKVADQTLQAALTMAALPIVNEARAKVPIAHAAYKLYGGGTADPGWLRQRIVRKKVKKTANSAEVIVTITDKRQAYFWKFIEFGTSKMPARPFMRPAFENRSAEALDRFVDRLKAGIAKAVTKLKFQA